MKRGIGIAALLLLVGGFSGCVPDYAAVGVSTGYSANAYVDPYATSPYQTYGVYGAQPYYYGYPGRPYYYRPGVPYYRAQPPGAYYRGAVIRPYGHYGRRGYIAPHQVRPVAPYHPYQPYRR